MTRTQFLGIVSLVLPTLGLGQGQNPGVEDNSSLVTSPTFSNSTCPIMGKAVSAKLFVDTELGRIYMCCKGCTKKILNDVSTAYKTAYPTTKKVMNKVCPIKGGKIEASSPRVLLQGHEVSVCCKDCVKKAQEEAPLVLAKVTNPKVVDLRNGTCPITGKPVEQNAFCLIGDSLVRLSSAQCVEDVKKDPQKTLEKAQEIRAREARAAATKQDGPKAQK